MAINNICGEIQWDAPDNLNKRIFLVCIEGKCMSGRIEQYRVLDEPTKVRIEISFIEPGYFENEVKIGNKFTIQDGSKVLTEGVTIKC